MPARVKVSRTIFAADYRQPPEFNSATFRSGSSIGLLRRHPADEWWHVPGGRPRRLLPQWWLAFQQWALTFQPAQSLVTNTLLPLQIAGMSASAKGSKLGVANAVGAV